MPSTYLEKITERTRTTPPVQLATDEAFWARYAREYDRDESFIQLNYGYYHPANRAVLDVELAMARTLNQRGAHFKIRESDRLLESTRADLSGLIGVEPDEIAITRNASEAMNIVIQGIALEAGDEVICSDQDYVNVDQAWAQRERDEGIRVRRVALPLDPRDDEEIVRVVAAAITPRTRLIQVTHLIHLTGQLLPAEKLCALARQHGIPVLVDAAHSFAHIDFRIAALDCDYLGASLHKWLGAPLGTGLLYVRKNRIAGISPLFGDTLHAAGDIRRLERFGNRPDSLHAGIREAIRWHTALGTAVKQARLAYLQRSWTGPLREWPRFQVLTPRATGRYGAIGLFALEGVPAETLCDYLLKEHRLFAGVQKLPTVAGVRITPGLPTSLAHIEQLLVALKAAARHFV